MVNLTKKIKKAIKLTTLVLLLLLAIIQFIPKKYNVAPNTNNSFLKLYNPPQEVESILSTSCFDCHSNNTRYPWYGKIQPINMFLNHHVEEAKDELNFDEFEFYSKRKKPRKIEAIIEEIEKDKMPLKSYTLLHSKAKLNKQQKETLINWLKTLNP